MSRPKLVPELYCSDIKTSLDFYLNLIGFSIRYERAEEGFAYLELDGIELMLEEAAADSDNPRTWWTAKAKKPYGRGINLQMEVDDVQEIHDRLLSANWPLFRAMEEKWYRVDGGKAGNRQFVVQDPDGYLLRLFTSLESQT